MWKLLLILIVTTVLDTCCSHNSEVPIVHTKSGDVKGSILKTVLGKTIYSFRGIRYAEPPVGNLRFKPPQPIEKWNYVYDATKDGPSCPQPFITPVSEDCLFLNIYSTKLNSNRPVIFYMHPGGFYSLTGNSQWAGPQYLLDHDVVLVTINYRLATLGLLSTGDHLAPGNNAFKDQVAALKWVHKNIEGFGGNSKLITLVGYSAGAYSITLHLTSPMSRGLFHRGVVMSASALGKGPILNDQLDLAKQQARLLGCPDSTSYSIIKCLKTKSSEEIANTYYGFQREGLAPVLLWQPVKEPDCGQERFIVDDPSTRIECKNFSHVPIMAGITFKELASDAYYIAANETLMKRLNAHFASLSAYLFNYEEKINSKYISHELKKFYFGSEAVDSSAAEALGKLYADSLTGFQVNRAVVQLSKHSDRPVYYYRFDYEGRFSFYYPPGTTTPNGVVHHDDLMYIFYIPALFPIFNQTDPEFKMMRKYTTLLYNFALTGDPTPSPSDQLDSVLWIPFNREANNYLQINDKMTMQRNMFKDRYDLWNKLFPTPEC